MSGDEDLKKALLQKELKNHFTPEFLNRLDEVIVFNPLKEGEVRRIVDIELLKLTNRLEKLGYHINFTDEVRDMLADVGFDEKYGARPIKRAIQEKIEDYISEEVLRQKIKIGRNYEMKMNEEEVLIEEGEK
jgi:ATP-dependent Clp protease ATP-binding subunit ClpC